MYGPKAQLIRSSRSLMINRLRQAQVPESIIAQTEWLCFNETKGEDPITLGLDPLAFLRQLQANFTALGQKTDSSKWRKMSKKECLKAYRVDLLPDRSDLLAISSTNASTSLLFMNRTSDINVLSYNWTCADPSSATEHSCVRQQAGNLSIGGFPIDFFLSRLRDVKCQLQFSFPLIIAVMISNMANAVCMILTVLISRRYIAATTDT